MTLFSEQLREKGRVAEQLAIGLCEQIGMRVTDVSGDPTWQGKDVDLLARLPNGLGIDWKIEVKSDRHITKSQNFSFELLRLYHDKGEQRHGWSHFSEADFFFVWDTDSVFYLFKAADVRLAKDKYVLASRPGNGAVRMVVSNDHVTTFNLLIPLSQLPYSVWVWDGIAWEKVR